MAATILLIEDDAHTTRLMEIQLRRQGFSPIVAPNGMAGLKMIRAELPDLILLDLMLPGIDGYEVLNQLRMDPQTANIPVVIVSAKPQLADRQLAARFGADAYVVKPHQPDKLANLIHSLIDQRQKIRPRGTGVSLVAPQRGETTAVTVNLGLALVGKNKTTTVVDLRPFSITHSLFLGIPPRPAPTELSHLETADQLDGLTVEHASGLRLLNNLEGSGEAGQLVPENARIVLNTLLNQEGYVLVDLPLYPVDVLRQVAQHCAQMLLISRSDPASLGTTRSALTMIQQTNLIEEARLGVVLVGPPDAQEAPVTNLGYTVLSKLPAEAGPKAPALDALAEWLLLLP